MPKLTALGGFDAKGPACFLLNIDGRRLLLDLEQGPDDKQQPNAIRLNYAAVESS